MRLAHQQSQLLQQRPVTRAFAFSRAATRLARQPVVSVRAAADAANEEIDPMTGLSIAKTSVSAKVAGNTIPVGKHTWAYRRSELDGVTKKRDLPVLLVHGLGSSSYSYRETLSLLGGEGYDAVAPDFLGYGDSDKPSDFPCTEEAYVNALDEFIAAIGFKKPFALVVQGYVLGQYALKWALQNPGRVDRLMILNTPLNKSSKLRPELAAYKAPLPFMRPGNKPFDAANYNANGGSYVMSWNDAEVYNKPYADSPAASEIISKTMDKLDWNKLLDSIDSGFMSWRIPTAICFGGSDPFLPLGPMFDFLESKRTNMKAMSITAKVGHMPQEDFPEALHEQMMLFLTGTPDDWMRAQTKSYKMSKKGAVAM